MKVLVDFEILQKYLPESELVKITEAANNKREIHKNYMRKKREIHKPENGENGSKTGFFGENPVNFTGVGGERGGSFSLNSRSLQIPFYV